ncbi:AraC family transcriptional regulator [Xylophilus sp. ASV27]|uniref:AraC family transcriptional regulator n=1 Tax=Xylophilus sp. ASV27 TaxID=2795129 RepID=UPI0018ED8C08|nr:AraC family transcriptional regulator [Xylophilus sp. ASV27]
MSELAPPSLAATNHPRDLERLGKAVAYLESHLSEAIDTGQLAARAALSPFHFHRLFHAYFGTTVTGYITWRRLQKACGLLAQADTAVLAVALEVGYTSAQALAKAMRREIDTTPTAVRAGVRPQWQQLFERRACVSPAKAKRTLQPRLTHTPELHVLTAVGRGMDQGNMGRAARQALGELIPKLTQAGLMPRMKSCLALMADEPQGPDDQQARMQVGAIFDFHLNRREGQITRPPLRLSGSLSWQTLPAGIYAVFTHKGLHRLLHKSWDAIYREWLPHTGYTLRDAPPFEYFLNDPRYTPATALRTEIYIPLD